MERLTEKQSSGYDLKAMNGEYCNRYCEQQRVETCNECVIYQAIQKLAQFEDLEELIGIPLKDIAKIFYQNIPEDCKHPHKAIVLTDDDIDKWNGYKNAEEQGLLIKLPCRVGDIIWDNDFGKPCAYRITGFSFGEADGYIDDPVITNDIVYYYSNYNGSIMGSFAMNEIGKSLFLTQEEAEQKLKEKESD